MEVSNTENINIDLSHYIRVLRRRKFEIILVAVVFMVIGLLYAKSVKPVYQSTVKIQADPVQPNALAQEQYIMNSMVFLFYETQYEIIKSRKVAETVVEKLNLVDKYRNEQEYLDSESERNFLQDFVSNIFKSSDKAVSPTQLSDSQIKTMLAKSIQSATIVSGGTQSQIIDISVQDQSPELSAKIANKIAESYIEFGLEARLSQIRDTAKWLEEQLEELRTTLQVSEDKLRAFRLSQNLMDTEQQERINNTQLQTLNMELVRAQTQLSEAKDLYTQVLAIENDGTDFRSLGPVLQSNTIRDLVREESALERKVKELFERYGEKHPKMIAARSDLAAAKVNLKNEAGKIVENIKKAYQSAQTKVANINSLINETRESLQSYQSESFELTRLEREVENNRRIYEGFLNKLMEADVSGDYDASNIRIIDSATNPEYPIKPNRALITIVATLLGFFVGLALAFAKEFMGNVIRIPDDIEENFGYPSLGLTPYIKERNGKKETKAINQYTIDQRSTFSEAINNIRTGLLFSNVDNPPKTILITSSNSSEGKSTLSFNLAVSLSHLGKTVLLELDLRKPVFKKELGLNIDKGITDLIRDENIVDSFCKIDGVENLTVIPCGSIPNNPIELISSQKFTQFLDSLKRKYDYIVIDSPPTIPVSDACVISKQADVTILALRAEETKIKVVKDTLHRLERVNANIGGIVLTLASIKKMSYYGEHYYNEKYYGI